jgi:hypothetical protein
MEDKQYISGEEQCLYTFSDLVYFSRSSIILDYTNILYSFQFKWELVKRAHQVFILHFALKKRAFIEEIHEKQEQVSNAIYTEFHLIAYI